MGGNKLAFNLFILLITRSFIYNMNFESLIFAVAEFKEFERRFKFKPWFKYGWFHLKLYQMFQDLSRRLI